MSENDKNVPLIVCDFHRKWVKTDTLSYFRFHIGNFESCRSLGRKVHFSQLPWDNQSFQESQTFCPYQCCPSDKFSRTI